MGPLNAKTVLITGASRGIGLAIALRCARDGANVAILAKTTEPHPTLPGTIYTAADEIRAAGGQALPIVCDIRDDAAVQSAVAQTVEAFGGVDICVNNASAIFPMPATQTPMKRFDLMHQVNARGSYLTSVTCLPHLMKADNPHILMLSPPLDMAPKWFGPHTAYSMAKFGMSMVVLGLAEEFAGKIAVNALWPRTAIATAAISNVLAGQEGMRQCRTPEILADAAHLMFTQPAASYSGRFEIDDTLLHSHGVTDFEQYRVDPTQDLLPDFFVPDDVPAPPGVSVMDLSSLLEAPQPTGG